METSVLQQIQSELKAPKSQFNDFGKYKYRNAEDIQEALKPILANAGHSLTLTDEMVQVGDRIYVKATAKLLDQGLKQVVMTTAYAREPESRKGMDEAQVTGATSSYARKYALGGMFLLDDTKDADSMAPDAGKTTPRPTTKPPTKAAESKQAAKDPAKWMAAWLEKAKELKASLGDKAYYTVLKLFGYEHANEVKTHDKASALYVALTAALDVKDLKDEPNTATSEAPGDEGSRFPPAEG